MSLRNSPLPFYTSPHSSSSLLSSQRTGGTSSSITRFLRCFSFRRTFGFRLREKYVLLFGIIILLCICYSGYAFLPDGPSNGRPVDGGVNIKKVIKEVWENIPQPVNAVLPKPNDYGVNKTFVRHEHGDMDSNDDPHKIEDRNKFLKRVEEDVGQIPKPKRDEEIEILEKNKNENDRNTKRRDVNNVNNNGNNPVVVTAIGDENEKRRDKIKEMMAFAWDSYAKYAWGANELRPISKVGHSASIFGQSPLGATIIDSLDTLYIMGLMDRFDAGRKWVELSLNFNDVRGDLSVFETNIRFVGGLLTAYALTKDELFKRKAVEVTDLLLPAFDTPTGIPYAMVNAKTKSGKNWGWASAGSSILSEFGTLHLEFEYLSVITGNPVYRDKVKKIRDLIVQIEKPDGLYPNYLNPKTGKWGSRHVSLGALGDSFYEYLLKSWLVTNKRDVEAKRLYEESMDAFERQLFIRSQSGLLYIAEMRGSRVDHKMDHLACFAGGMFALHAVNSENETVKEHWLSNAADIANTCHESYIRTETRLGPESFRFTNEFEAKTVNDREKYYILRPEVIETWFYLWRTTKDEKYREWGWEAAMALELYCRTEGGFSGIKNVYTRQVTKDDVQQSFFLAETLKYLYLLFSPDNVMSLDKWVFNTEAHPLPIRFRDEDHTPAVPMTVAGDQQPANFQKIPDRKPSPNVNNSLR